jgi:hypothetical protein
MKVLHRLGHLRLQRRHSDPGSKICAPPLGGRAPVEYAVRSGSKREGPSVTTRRRVARSVRPPGARPRPVELQTGPSAAAAGRLSIGVNRHGVSTSGADSE